MIGQVRTARPAIILNGKDYYNALAPYLVTFKYEDNCDGKKADDLHFELADREGKFISTWAPQKGANLDASIIASRWFSPIGSDLTLDCGRFWIDSVEFELPAHKVIVKANSIPTNVRIKAGIESRGWEKTSLKDIATQIAGESQMSVDWQATSNPRYLRTEMHDESGLAFLQQRARNAKLAIKVHRNKVVIFDELKLEQAAPSFTLLYGNTPVTSSGACYRMAGGNFTTTLSDTTKKAKVKHTDVGSGDVKQGQAESSEQDDTDGTGEPDVNAPLDIDHLMSEDTDSDDDDGGGGNGGNGTTRAEPGSATQWNASDTVKAESVVRDKTKHKYKAKIDMSIGNPLIAAGMTFTLKGVGQYDGKWFIESAHHEVGPEYKTELQVRRCLQSL